MLVNMMKYIKINNKMKIAHYISLIKVLLNFIMKA